MKIKRLCLANGDEYENITTELGVKGLIKAIDERVVIKLNSEGKEIILNTDFIISFEIGESKKLLN